MPVEKLKSIMDGAGLYAAPRTADAVFFPPVSWMHTISKGEGDLLLHGGGDVDGKGRYSYVAARPLFIVKMRGSEGELFTGFERHKFIGRPPELIAAIDALFARYQQPAGDDGVWNGGMVWLFGYEMNRYYEPRLDKGAAPATDDLWCAFYPSVRVFDHKERRAWDVAWRDTPRPRMACAIEEASHLGAFSCDESRGDYLAKIARVKRYIEAGDVYQVNLSRRLSAEWFGSGLLLYSRMARVSPSSMGAYIDGGRWKLLSASPELFFRVRGGVIETEPIKGTAPRRKVLADDAREREQLAASAKDRAENVMIVDLMRSDLAKVCAPGSVAAPDICRVETLPHVHHLVSTVRGGLRGGVRLPQLMEALWPGGSVTGAPKVRAMEIIQELETTPRGFYCGSVAACGMNGGITASLLIRTLYCEKGEAVYRTGGGITADSDPAKEFEETEHKARAATALGEG